MTLSVAQLTRVAALEAHLQRLRELACMSAGQLHALLAGDAVVAASWIASAAECGLPAAQLRLGRLLLEGRGLPRDPAAAYRWFARAAHGDAEAAEAAEAMNMVGRCHENGWGVPQNFALAASHYRRSAEAGHDWGQYNLGHLLFDGRGVARDRRAALHWYLSAARAGHERAMNLVGRCLEEGWGCAPDVAQAAGWYARSAERGYARAQFNHALLLAQQGHAELAAEWFGKAALGGSAALRRAIIAAVGGAAEPVLREAAERVRQMP
jgi:uncharacterized protein